MYKKLLEVKGLETRFKTDEGIVTVLDNVSFDIKLGETLGVVGESGSGKSVTALSVMRLLPSHAGIISAGEVLLEGKNLLHMGDREMQDIRGNDIAMIFQEPMTSLDPVYNIGYQVMESICKHQSVGKKEATRRTLELLRWVGIPSPDKRINDYPHQLSGGMRQRVMIAIALSCNPRLLIADEPTTALDVTIQAQILDLLRKMKNERNMSILLITHDFGVVAEMCDRVIVMYGGRIVEVANIYDIFENPKHPYTVGLLNSIPRLDENAELLNVIRGNVPNMQALPKGCCFHPRCDKMMELCSTKIPEIREVAPKHYVACHCYS